VQLRAFRRGGHVCVSVTCVCWGARKPCCGRNCCDRQKSMVYRRVRCVMGDRQERQGQGNVQCMHGPSQRRIETGRRGSGQMRRHGGGVSAVDSNSHIAAADGRWTRPGGMRGGAGRAAVIHYDDAGPCATVENAPPHR
jgi:hypothetical protein